jgi:hypothetical protein
MKTLSKRLVLTALCGVIPLTLAQVALANNLVLNGGFESTTAGAGQLGYNTEATGWSTSGYNFLFTPGSADTTGAVGQYGSLYLWGPNDGSANGLPATSPAGGNYIGADGAYQVGAISQTISGLTVGQTYALSFYWAGVQQYGFTGDTTENWTASLGSQSQTTTTVTPVSHGFSGWIAQTFDYTATSTSETLSFLATGTPSGEPPFSLLDGVSLSAVPESATMWVSVFVLLPVCGLMLRNRRQKVPAKA